MYAFVLFIHSWLRYAVLAAGIALLVVAITQLRSDKRWSPRSERLATVFLASLDTQLLLGLLLYFALSPLTSAGLADLAAAMKSPVLRFFSVEHSLTMFLAVVVAHVGRVRAKRKPDDQARLRTVLRFQIAWLVLTLAAIPWPGLDIGRPLFRGL
ncbi:MAG: hypothetical protein OXU20_19520 [Myxococcales bacterium]|nr:hypothetical protein [Myxococcales bacterium]MDD9964704.1 hypothetical protein [Myxococcales bacterium]